MMIQIDGSTGEGGGQVLRTSLGLSLLTGQPFTITVIRGRRRKPGLLRQHLTAVRAAIEIGGAVAVGAEVNSTTLSFTPGTLRPGSYHYAIGTAGSCTLVFQAILPALLQADKKTELTIEGGTHNPMAPPYDFLNLTFLPLLQRMGPEVRVTMERPGFFPAGGGRIRLTVEPVKTLRPIELLSLTSPKISAQSLCAQLPTHIGQREIKVVQNRLKLSDDQCQQVSLDKYGPGNTLTIAIASQELTETFTGFGQRNVSAEKVAAGVVKEVRTYLENKAPVGPYLADQLLIPMAMAGGGCFRTGRPSSHARTNMEIIQQFLPVTFSSAQQEDGSWVVSCQ